MKLGHLSCVARPFEHVVPREDSKFFESQDVVGVRGLSEVGDVDDVVRSWLEFEKVLKLWHGQRLNGGEEGLQPDVEQRQVLQASTEVELLDALSSADDVSLFIGLPLRHGL